MLLDSRIFASKKNMHKIRYRLVFNRKKQLNKQGTALVQVELSLNQRKIYLKTDVYLKPEWWNHNTSLVHNHPHEFDINAMLYEYLIHLQSIELSYWKRGVTVTLSLIKEAVRKNVTPSTTFTQFAEQVIEESDRKESTKNNLRSTITMLNSYRPLIEFDDLNYTFLRDLEAYLRDKGNSTNTIAKHLRQIRTLTNEAINQGYMHQDAYPFRKFKIKNEKSKHKCLTLSELSKLEKLNTDNRKVLDAFLFCCYTGLRYSDFKQLQDSFITKTKTETWLNLNSIKTGSEIKLPLHLLFEGKAIDILQRYDSLESFVNIPCNAATNEKLREFTEAAKIGTSFTFHSARHTCATHLLHQGVAMSSVQKLLGHTSIKTTEIYAEVLQSTLVKELKSVKRSVKKNVQANSSNSVSV